MDEQNLDSVDYEVAPQEAGHDESMHSHDNSQEISQNREKEEAQERNWRAMRQREREMEYQLKQQNELIDRLLKSTQTHPSIPAVVEEEEPDDEYVPAGKVKGIARKTVQPLEKKIADLEAKLAQQEQQKLLQSLHAKYSDFDDVVNVETLEMLEKTEPELAATIAQFGDPYKVGLHAYKYIKALGLVDKLPNARHTKEVIQKMERNEKAVQSPTAYGKRPMAQAFKSTQADKTRLYEEMMFYASQANGL